MPLSRAQRDALDRSVSATRMGTYVRVSGGDADLARARYLWDRELAVAFFADIALLEIAVRNAMNDRLAERWGERWYERAEVPLDDRTAAQLAEAHGRVVGPKLPGRVVAQCTFGSGPGSSTAGRTRVAIRGGCGATTTWSCGEESWTARSPAVARPRARTVSAGAVPTRTRSSPGSTRCATAWPTTSRSSPGTPSRGSAAPTAASADEPPPRGSATCCASPA
jgi:hypothetical protein